VDIFANKQYRVLPRDLEMNAIRVVPYFTNHPYTDATNISRSYGVDDYLIPYARDFERELRALESEGPLLLPTAFPYQICGAAFAGWTSPVHAITHRGTNYYANHPREHWEVAFKVAKTLRRPFECYVFEPALQKHFAKTMEAKVRVRLAPYPVLAFNPGAAFSRSNYIGILGGLRADQGQELVPMVVNAILQSGFKVLLQDVSGIIESAPHPDVKIIGFIDDFRAVMSECAAIIINYHPESYATASSAVAWEAMLTATPILHTRHIATAQMLESFNCGIPFDYGNEAQLLKALMELKRNYPQHARRAKQGARKYQEKHGIKQFVDCLIQNGFVG
jgi:hypothetical protein